MYYVHYLKLPEGSAVHKDRYLVAQAPYREANHLKVRVQAQTDERNYSRDKGCPNSLDTKRRTTWRFESRHKWTKEIIQWTKGVQMSLEKFQGVVNLKFSGRALRKSMRFNLTWKVNWIA